MYIRKPALEMQMTRYGNLKTTVFKRPIVKLGKESFICDWSTAVRGEFNEVGI